jgi:RNA polymerase sigma-70 factor (family 1)
MPDKAPLTDPNLLQAIAKGDQLAFKKLFDLYRPNIYTTAYRILDDEWLAEEILQDTFLKVWLKRAELPAIVNLPGWLYTIARNYTYNALKNIQTERKALLALAEEALNSQSPETGRFEQEDKLQALLAQAVERLPEKQKQTYILIKQQDMKRDEVARELNVSPETVKWNLEQAMKSIRKFCAAHLDEAAPILSLYLFIKYF